MLVREGKLTVYEVVHEGKYWLVREKYRFGREKYWFVRVLSKGDYVTGTASRIFATVTT